MKTPKAKKLPSGSWYVRVRIDGYGYKGRNQRGQQHPEEIAETGNR